MGHSEMLLAVAGMDEDGVTERVKRLATGDFASFPRSERVAFAFARRMTTDPASVTDADVAELVEVFGTHRAIDVIWHVAWGSYMTRIADAFQLPLEKTNVFASPPGAKD